MQQNDFQTFSTWFQQVRKYIRFKPDLDAIERELSTHYEDHYQDLRQLGYDETLAEERALRAMGDPEVVGKTLDAVHKPWLGWLWIVSKVLCIAAVSVAIIYSLVAGPLSGPITEIFKQKDARTWDGDYTRIREFCWSQEDGSIDPWWKPAVQIAMGRGAQSVERAGYTITVPYAEVWEMAIADGRTERFYFVALRVEDRHFWDDGPKYLIQNLALRDACGRYFDDNYYHYTFDEEGKAVWPSDGYLRTVFVERNAFSATWFMECHGIVQRGDLGEEAELQYTAGTLWELPILWEEVAYD